MGFLKPKISVPEPPPTPEPAPPVETAGIKNDASKDYNAKSKRRKSLLSTILHTDEASEVSTAAAASPSTTSGTSASSGESPLRKTLG